MEAVKDFNGLAQSANIKKDLRGHFSQVLKEFQEEAINGSITLHFSHGYLAKVHSTKVE